MIRQLTNHDNEIEQIVQDDTKRRRKVLEQLEIRALHDAVRHALDDRPRDRNPEIRLVHPDKRLEEADEDEEQQREEDDALLHHNLEHHQHCAEEAERVEEEQQAHPEHGRREREEVVAQSVEVPPLLVVHVGGMRQRDHAEDERDRQERVQR